MFLMNAVNVNFTNSKANPVRPWFKRMVDQLESNAYNTSGLNWNDLEMNIIMSPCDWKCISRIYAYGNYYDFNRLIGVNVYFTTYTDYVASRHKEYLDQCALPIGGRMYPVVLDNKISDILFNTYISGQVNEEFSGCIQNVNCYFK